MFATAGPLSRDLLTSGVEALLVEPLPRLQTMVSVPSSEAPLSPLAVTATRHSRTDVSTQVLSHPVSETLSDEVL